MAKLPKLVQRELEKLAELRRKGAWHTAMTPKDRAYYRALCTLERSAWAATGDPRFTAHYREHFRRQLSPKKLSPKKK